MPRHRLVFEVDPSFPKCRSEADFLAIVSAWIKPSVFAPPASRELAVRIRRLPDGGKSADVAIKDGAGTELGRKHHDYSPDTECFKVLYWTGFDAATLMGAFEPPPPPPPPPPAPPPPPSAASTATPERKPDPTCPAPTPVVPQPPTTQRRYFVGGGANVAYNLAPETAVGPRVLLGLERGAFVGEVDARWLPLLETRPAGITGFEVHTVAFSAAACLKRSPVFACGVAMGGAAHAETLDRRFSRPTLSGFFGIGFRAGVEAPFTRSLALRFDAEGAWIPEGLRVNGKWFGLWQQPLPLYVSGGASVVFVVE